MSATLVDQARAALSRKSHQGAVEETPPSQREDLFRVVDMAALKAEDDPQEWYWDGRIPANYVTILGGHGGAGKSTLADHLGACVAMGAEFLGSATQRTRVLYFSAEDPAKLVLKRLRRVCRALQFSFDEVMEWMQVIDAADLEPVLFTERRIDGERHGVITPTFAALRDYVQREGFGLVIIDNASDTFEADEVRRSSVRAFMRSLTQLARPHGGAVLLLVHVDKLTAKTARSGGSEGYSGSTAWHNSARSRMLLVEVEPGRLELLHQKCNVGPKLGPLRIEWPENEVMRLEPQEGGFVAALQSKADTAALLRLIHEFAQREEFVAASPSSRHNAVRLLAEEKTLPKLKPAEVFALLRNAERDALLVKERYQDANRKWHECWSLTDGARVVLGIAPSAPTAPTSPPGTANHGAVQVRQPRQPARGGCGGDGEAHEEAAV